MKKSEFKIILAKELIKIISNCISQTHGMDFKIKIKSNNIYITIHRYGEDFHIYLFKNGNIQFKFKEFCHRDYICNYYQYEENDDFENLIKIFKKDCKALLTAFIEAPGFWHVLLDYFSFDPSILDMKLKRNNDKWLDNLQIVKKECGLF